MGNGSSADEEQRSVEPQLVKKAPGAGPPQKGRLRRYCQTFPLESPTPSAALQMPNVATRGQADPGRYKIFAGEILLGYASSTVSRNFDSHGGADGILSGAIKTVSGGNIIVRLCIEG